jgi:hypothetical protein
VRLESLPVLLAQPIHELVLLLLVVVIVMFSFDTYAQLYLGYSESIYYSPCPFPTFSRLCKEKSSLQSYDNEEFRRFLLQSMNEKSARSRIRYANEFAHVLESGDAQSLLQLSAEKRLHVMKSLTCLSKFLGCHDTTWIVLKRKYNLKWTAGGRPL